MSSGPTANLGGIRDTERIMAESYPSADDDSDKQDVPAWDSGQVAGVTWLGYDAPIGPVDAARPEYAERGGVDLAGFYDGLQATHNGDPHLVAAGHSYGSTTTGYALRETTAPDEAAVWGSPGVTTQDASDLHMLPGDTYATRADDDPIRYAPVHGGDPMESPDFTHMNSEKHGDLSKSSGHSEYTNEGTTSLHNLGQLLRGEDPDYVDP